MRRITDKVKFSTTKGKLESAELTADYEKAEIFEKTRIGNLGVYYPSGFGLKFISYDELEQAFIRIHEVDGKLCCGKATFYYYRLVLVVNGKEYTDIISENEALMDQALDAIARKSVNTKIGK